MYYQALLAAQALPTETRFFKRNGTINAKAVNQKICKWDFECLTACSLGYASYHVYKIGCLLVRGISFPAAQLFVIAIENILQGGEEFSYVGTTVFAKAF